MTEGLTPQAQELVTALQHLRGADHALKQCVTLLRQAGQEVPEGVEDALTLVEDAISSLES